MSALVNESINREQCVGEDTGEHNICSEGQRDRYSENRNRGEEDAEEQPVLPQLSLP
jgi:hypothetical protein